MISQLVNLKTQWIVKASLFSHDIWPFWVYNEPLRRIPSEAVPSKSLLGQFPSSTRHPTPKLSLVI